MGPSLLKPLKEMGTGSCCLGCSPWSFFQSLTPNRHRAEPRHPSYGFPCSEMMVSTVSSAFLGMDSMRTMESKRHRRDSVA